jgi:hypothetical protein
MNYRKDKYQILYAVAARGLTAREAADLFSVNRHTVEKWCREEGISMDGHKHPRVGFILKMKRKRLSRLIRELAVLQREVKALQGQDPSAAYIPPKPRRK